MICFDDHPNIPAVPPWGWESWLVNLYGLEGMNTFNTVWIHLACCEKTYTYKYVYKFLTDLNLSNLPHVRFSAFSR